MITKVRNSAAVAIFVAISLIVATSLDASELGETNQRLHAARSQQDMQKIYESIDREFGGDTTKILAFLRKSGFSCQQGTVLFKVKCVFAYCGDRPFFPLLFQTELMSIGVIIDNDGPSTDVVHHQTKCPRTASLLKKTQEYLLKGESPGGRQ